MIRPVPTIRCLAPAKINLFLSVGRPDARGYHPLRTIFQAVGLFDVVTVAEARSETSVTFDVPGIPDINTVSRAIDLYKERFELPPLSVHVSKSIPSQAGLGGGSSDAATVLRILQRISGDALSETELARLALQIGADVPFFLVGGVAKAEGYGEVLTPLDDEPRRWLVLARPDEGCPTGPMFEKLDSLDYAWKAFPEDHHPYNDFERVAPCACIDLIERLQVHGAGRAGLSGSGSAVFGVFEDEARARHAIVGLKSEGVPWVEVAPTLSREESLNGYVLS